MKKKLFMVAIALFILIPFINVNAAGEITQVDFNMTLPTDVLRPYDIKNTITVSTNEGTLSIDTVSVYDKTADNWMSNYTFFNTGSTYQIS